MSTYKRLCLLLCSLFMCCVGFLSVSSRAYAYTAEDGFYPIISNSSRLEIYLDSLGNREYYTPTIKDNKYFYNNSLINNVYSIQWTSSFEGNNNVNFTFPYNPDLYDYYFLGNLTSVNKDVGNSTFKPTKIEMYGKDYTNDILECYILDNVGFYDLDTDLYSGFGWYGKVDFASANNIGIGYINFFNDKDGFGSKPANLVLDMGILAVEKGQSETAVMSQILNQLQNMENSINDSIGSAADQVTDAIEKQYGMNPGESFGVQDLTSQVEEKLGVLSFGADTLNNFLGLFQASNAGSTVLTFPGFTIDVQGESYQVWNDMQFDLAFLEENFGFLVDTVRTVTVLCVWLAVLGYLVKAYEHLVNNKG